MASQGCQGANKLRWQHQIPSIQRSTPAAAGVDAPIKYGTTQLSIQFRALDQGSSWLPRVSAIAQTYSHNLTRVRITACAQSVKASADAHR